MKNYRCINLDCASKRTFDRIVSDPGDPRRGIAARMSAARHARLRGDIDRALRLEAKVDAAIEKLPAHLRW